MKKPDGEKLSRVLGYMYVGGLCSSSSRRREGIGQPDSRRLPAVVSSGKQPLIPVLQLNPPTISFPPYSATWLIS